MKPTSSPLVVRIEGKTIGLFDNENGTSAFRIFDDGSWRTVRDNDGVDLSDFVNPMGETLSTDEAKKLGLL